MLFCKKVREQMSDYADGQLSPARMAFVKMHLAMCDECDRLFRSLRSTVSLLRELKDEPVDEAGS
jgi:anti-sigma factor RsiW